MPGECADHERPKRVKPHVEHRCAARLLFAGFRAVNAHARSAMTPARETSRRKRYAHLAVRAPLQVVHPSSTDLNHPGCAGEGHPLPAARFSKESGAKN